MGQLRYKVKLPISEELHNIRSLARRLKTMGSLSEYGDSDRRSATADYLVRLCCQRYFS